MQQPFLYKQARAVLQDALLSLDKISVRGEQDQKAFIKAVDAIRLVSNYIEEREARENARNAADTSDAQDGQREGD